MRQEMKETQFGEKYQISCNCVLDLEVETVDRLLQSLLSIWQSSVLSSPGWQWGELQPGEQITQRQELYFDNSQETGAFLFRVYFGEVFVGTQTVRNPWLAGKHIPRLLADWWRLSRASRNNECHLTRDQRIQSQTAFLLIIWNPLILFELERKTQSRLRAGCWSQHAGTYKQTPRDWRDSRNNLGKCQG